MITLDESKINKKHLLFNTLYTDEINCNLSGNHRSSFFYGRQDPKSITKLNSKLHLFLITHLNESIYFAVTLR